MTVAPVAGLAGLLRRSGRPVECAVEGESMGAAVPGGATVRIRCDGAAEAPVGAVVALLLGGGLTVHRLIHRGRSARARGWVVTEGDANLTCDAPVRDVELLGVVEAIRVGDGAWQAPGAATRRPRLRGAASALARTLVCAGLEVHPRVADGIKRLIVLGMVPVVWLRPYPPGARRRASVAHQRDG